MMQMGMKTHNIRLKMPKINPQSKTFKNYLEELGMVVADGEALRKIGGATKQLGFMRFA